jgi:hypothetical protein
MTKTRPLHVRFLEYNTLDGESTLTKQLHYPMVEVKRVIQEFQSLLAMPDFNNQDTYKFKDGAGMVSFAPLKSTYLSFGAPALVLNSQAQLYIKEPNGRSVNLLKEIEKDGPEDKLQKVFQKLMTPSGMQKIVEAPPTRKGEKSKSRPSPSSAQL